MLNCCIERRKAREFSVYGEVSTTTANSAGAKQNSATDDDEDEDDEFYECETDNPAAAATETLNTQQCPDDNDTEGWALVTAVIAALFTLIIFKYYFLSFFNFFSVVCVFPGQLSLACMDWHKEYHPHIQKTIHTTQPAYLNSVLEHYTPTRTLRSSDTNLLCASCPYLFWF